MMNLRPVPLACLLLIALAPGSRGAGPPAARGSVEGPETPSSPQEALAALALPEGFRASLFASEPEVRQPIAIATDARGRLWVCENETYSERAVNFDMNRHDRITILEDADHDGRAERRTVFWDGGQKLTSVEVGFGGVWALCPPNLLFLPDRNGDDVPDGAPEVVLDGWDGDSVRHNIANGLRWGPDGWLYGRHGIQATSYVGRPGTPPDRRVALNCSIWRYHPTRKAFEVVCRGTTNAWGMDWDASGEPFFINTVIGHLWHAVPGAHFQRMYGEDFDPHLYRLLGQTADHFHWDTAEAWGATKDTRVSPTTDQAGGGHAHAGLLVYQGDNWPDRYRGSAFAINLHGRRVNRDTLERRGSGYVGRHAPDFLRSSDPWFRAIDLIAGNDGGVYLADWSDVGECHEQDAVHRASGRIFKITHGQPARPAVGDVAALADADLVGLLGHPNDWYARQARRVLQERAADGRPTDDAALAALREASEGQSDPARRLRAAWALYAVGGLPEARMLRMLDDPDEHVRVWGVRLLVDAGEPSAAAVGAFAAKARGESSGLVLLYLASALQKLRPADRWDVAEGLAAHAEFADDPALPLMVWYGIEPAVTGSPARAVALAGSAAMPAVGRHVARRITEDLAGDPAAVDRLVALVGRSDPARQRVLVDGMAEALRGWRKAPPPASWAAAREALGRNPDEVVRQRARELAVVFGDGRAVDDLKRLATSNREDAAIRRDAIRGLVEARAEGVVPILRGLVTDRDLGAEAVRGLGSFDDPGTPGLLLGDFPRLRPEARAEAIVALSGRPAYARPLLAAVAAGSVDRRLVPAFQVRQMRGFADPEVRRLVAATWPEVGAISSARGAQIARLKARLDPPTLAAADLADGRRLFVKSCASCHVLFGEGGAIGPDLTGAQRTSLDYLLENIAEPAATLAADYRMSTVALADGRVIDGIVGPRAGPTLAVQTPTERVVLNRDDVEEIRPTDRSLMPEGLLDVLTDDQVRDLIAYLMSPRQVPLPNP